MSKKSAVFLLVIALAGGGYYYYRTQLSCSFLTQKTVRISGKDYDVRPKEGLAKCGLKLRRVPDGRNAAILYCKASNVYVEPDRAASDVQYDVRSGSWREDPHFTSWFDSNAECLELLHEAVGKRDCQFPFLGKGDDILTGLLTQHLTAMRAFARLLVSEGRYFEHKGDESRALESYLAVSMLAQHAARSEQTLIGVLVAITCQQVGSTSIERWLANTAASTGDLEKAIKQLERNLAECPRMSDWTEFERAFSRHMLDLVADNPAAAAAFANSDARATRAWQVVRGTIGRHTEIWTRVWDKFEAWCARPASETLQPGKGWDNMQLSKEESAYRLAFMSGLGRARVQIAKSEAQLGGVAVFAAIKLYEKKNGRPPASLAELKGEYISELPKDPFSGRDYVYKVRGADWILYSVWDNLTDDNGVGSWPHKVGTDKDLIWRNTRIAIE